MEEEERVNNEILAFITFTRCFVLVPHPLASHLEANHRHQTTQPPETKACPCTLHSRFHTARRRTPTLSLTYENTSLYPNLKRLIKKMYAQSSSQELDVSVAV